MTKIDIFYQREGSKEIDRIEIEAGHTAAAVRALLIEKHGLTADVLIFIEDADEPLEDHVTITPKDPKGNVKAHVHRCRHVGVSVTFNGRAETHRFGPSATVARVKRWAAEKFGLSPQDAGEHVLQLSGTHERPTPGTHLGALAKHPVCSVAFDLVPEQRVNGAPEREG